MNHALSQSSSKAPLTSRGRTQVEEPLLSSTRRDGEEQHHGRGISDSRPASPGLAALGRVPQGASYRRNDSDMETYGRWKEQQQRIGQRGESEPNLARIRPTQHGGLGPERCQTAALDVPLWDEDTNSHKSNSRFLGGSSSSWFDMRVFMRGGRRSIISPRGEVNVHRLIPEGTKLYLNWFYDAFACIIRLPYKKLFLYITITYVLTIGLYAVGLQIIDPHYICASSVNNFPDYYFFVVQTIFTIGYGGKEPLCFGTNVGVTIISILGMIMHTALTGIVFTKFTLDNSRNVACAFSTRLLAIPPPGCDHEAPLSVSSGEDKDRAVRKEDEVVEGAQLDKHLRLCFRFVDVFHRNFFHVNMRLFLVEHDTSLDGWSCPTVQELHFFDTSMPLEFMSLPVEVCAYIPLDKLAVIADIDDEADADSISSSSCDDVPGGESNPLSCSNTPSPSLAGDGKLPTEQPYDNTNTITLRERNWVRHFSPGFSNHIEALNHRTLPPIPKSVKGPGAASLLQDSPGPAVSPERRLRQMQSTTSKSSSSFELVCTVEFTDATTGNEINARKSWPLSEVTWLPAGTEGSLCWAQIVKRIGDDGSYDVDVSNLDALTDDAYDLVEANRMESANDMTVRGESADSTGCEDSEGPTTGTRHRRAAPCRSHTLSDWGIKFNSSSESSESTVVPSGGTKSSAGDDHDIENPRDKGATPHDVSASSPSHEKKKRQNTSPRWRSRWRKLRSRLVDSLV
ncbi:hypothetical protein FOZ62_014347 [Perkinsus olseni]|uniref:Potassium channel inwardly rectifying transmembrane domain-containing protein n=1 Tax=Perkinsus olseni TaxID=32597 RepID=A0A7J6QHA8_PEROL|nr:hypothetical protein FOZ62_014347 [Perkinsus olseni]